MLVLRRRRRFVRHRKKKAGVCLENMGFSADVGAGIKEFFWRIKICWDVNIVLAEIVFFCELWHNACIG